jgi:hypothetical protein
VVSEPVGISCPGHCSEEFAEGHAITLIAEPAPHNKIAAWSGCGSLPNARECKVTMSGAKSISVQFAPIPPEDLSVSVAGSGEVLSYPAGIACPGSCSAQFDEGGTAYLIPSPDPGFLFAGWQGARCAGTGLCAVAMQEAEAVSAKFETGLPPIETIPPAPRGPGLPAAAISLRRVALKGRPALAATVSSAGELSILNRWLRRTRVQASTAGVVVVPLRLNGSGKAAIKRFRHHRLRVKLTVVFMPSDRGTPALASAVVIFVASRSGSTILGISSTPTVAEGDYASVPPENTVATLRFVPALAGRR